MLLYWHLTTLELLIRLILKGESSGCSSKECLQSLGEKFYFFWTLFLFIFFFFLASSWLFLESVLMVVYSRILSSFAFVLVFSVLLGFGLLFFMTPVLWL